MFHGSISLNPVLLLLLVNFVSGCRLQLMYISLILSIRSSLTHLHGFLLLVLLQKSFFFHMHQQNTSSESQVKFRKASNYCKRVLQLAKLAYASKTKEAITLWSNDLVIKVLGSQSRRHVFKPLGGSKVDSAFHSS